MSERPILFSAPLVRAILAGKKTETRRLVTKGTSVCAHPWDDLDFEAHAHGEPHNERCAGRDYCSVLVDGRSSGSNCEYLHVPGKTECRHRVYCRIEPGDTLWVRETWRVIKDLDDLSPSAVTASARVQYEADGPPCNPQAWGKVRQSIFMPRWASRITLKVNEVKAERLHEITEAGARAEGVEPHMRGFVARSGVAAFCDLWTEINGKRPGARWDDNPWVWVIKFEVLGGSGAAEKRPEGEGQ